ncbi:MAG: four helix bundle protein [Deltaproteobacteria bacterium]|nr:four helix bundle protein [Deltaproteobacteria bacterium]
MQKSRSYRDLEVWKLSIDLVKEIYSITAKFPDSEVYGLTNQMRRAAVSISSNIAEGQGRNSNKIFCQYLDIAIGSVGELETQLIISKEINYITTEKLDFMSAILDRIRKMIRSLSRKLP